MLELLRPIADFDIWIYIFLGLIALFFVRKVWIAYRNRTRSIFALEKEHANTQMTNGFIGLLVVLSIVIGIFILTENIPEIVPPPPATPTPTRIIELPPTPTPPPLLRITPTATPTPTPTLVPLPTEPFVTLTPPPAQQPPSAPASGGQPANCPHPGARITSPGSGAQVNGMVQIRGAANVENFDYYKFEFRIPGGEWSFAARYNISVNNGVLGSWNSDTVPPGEYEFRLVVVDHSGNYPEPCVIRLTVQ